MASLASVYLDIGRQFICSDCHLDCPAIKAALLGGSSIYSAEEVREKLNGSDWDGVVIVSGKLAIFQLVNEQRQSLMEMLGIVREECPGLRVLEASSARWDQFDAVIFADFDQRDNNLSKF